MKTGHSLIAAAMLTAVASASAQVFPDSNVMVAQGTTQDQKAQQELKGMEKVGQRDDTQPMTAAQQAQYKSEYQAAKAKWALADTGAKIRCGRRRAHQEIERPVRTWSSLDSGMTCSAKRRRSRVS